MRCSHPHKRLVRVVGRDGRVQVMEQCQVCLESARGPGVWVPRAQVAVPLEELPLLRDLRSAEDKGEQPTLF